MQWSEVDELDRGGVKGARRLDGLFNEIFGGSDNASKITQQEQGSSGSPC